MPITKQTQLKGDYKRAQEILLGARKDSKQRNLVNKVETSRLNDEIKKFLNQDTSDCNLQNADKTLKNPERNASQSGDETE